MARQQQFTMQADRIHSLNPELADHTKCTQHTFNYDNLPISDTREYLYGSQVQSTQWSTHIGLALHMCDLHHSYYKRLWKAGREQ